MAKRRSSKHGVLDWWQTIFDETKDLVDDTIDRIRDDDDEEDELADEIKDLKKAVAALNAKLDVMMTEKAK